MQSAAGACRADQAGPAFGLCPCSRPGWSGCPIRAGRLQRQGRPGRGAGPAGPSVGQPLDRRAADLAWARADRPHRPSVGRAHPGPRPARRPPHQDPAVPLDARDLARLTAAGAQPAGPPPLPPASGDVIEVERTVNASGNVRLGDRVVSAGLPLAGQRVTLRLEGPVAHVLANGVLARTVACPVPPEARPRLRGARTGTGTAQPPRLPEPLVVTRRVPVRGSVMVGGQKIQVGLAHAQDCPGQRRTGHLPDHRRDRHHRYRTPECQPGHQTAQGVKLRLRTAVQQRQAAGPGCGASPCR